jgi:protein-disulfide isomerase
MRGPGGNENAGAPTTRPSATVGEVLVLIGLTAVAAWALYATFGGGKYAVVTAGATGKAHISVLDGKTRIDSHSGVTELVGNPSVALVEFSDFVCPYCGTYARTILPNVRQQLVNTSVLALQFKQFPLRIHPPAFNAAVAAVCAGEQGQYVKMHDLMFEHQHELDAASVLRYAVQIRLDTERFKECLTGPAVGSVRADMLEGQTLGVSATPTFFIGRVSRDGHIVLLRKIEGAIDVETLRKEVDAVASATADESANSQALTPPSFN